MKSSVIVFPGSNCDRDIAVALEKMQFKNHMVWHKDTTLPKSDLIVIPGGFSYGDYLRSGAIAGKSLIINEVIKASEKGCLILSHPDNCFAVVDDNYDEKILDENEDKYLVAEVLENMSEFHKITKSSKSDEDHEYSLERVTSGTSISS